MNYQLGGKLFPVVTLSITVLVLASFCCPWPVERGNIVYAGQQPPEGGSEAGPEGTSGQNPLKVTPREQEGYYSCWATCAEMVMEFLGAGRVRQCEQANVAFSRSTCCAGVGVLAHGLCDAQWYPEFEKWGFDSDFQHRDPLTWEQLTTEINEGRPFVFSWVVNPPVNINHMMVLVGYDEGGGEKTVIYLEPLYAIEADAVQTPFSDYIGATGGHPHRSDYFRIRPATY